MTHNLKVIAMFYYKMFRYIILFHYIPHFAEYKRLKVNVTDEGGEKHVYDVTGCKSGCNMNRFLANVKEKMRIRNATGTSYNQVFLF